jgi:hypothetical protein
LAAFFGNRLAEFSLCKTVKWDRAVFAPLSPAAKIPFPGFCGALGQRHGSWTPETAQSGAVP